MAKSVADVMSMVKDNDVKFVDFRFTDTRGKWQHITIPVSQFEEDKFEQGQAFDGSSMDPVSQLRGRSSTGFWTVGIGQ